MFAEFISHFTPVLLLRAFELRRVYLPLGGRKRGRWGDLSQDQVKEETEAPGLSQRAWRTTSTGKYVCIWEYICGCVRVKVCVYVCRYERVMCMCMKVHAYLRIYVCMYVHVGVSENMCV